MVFFSLASPIDSSACDWEHDLSDRGERRRVRAHAWLKGPSLPFSGQSCTFLLHGLYNFLLPCGKDLELF